VGGSRVSRFEAPPHSATSPTADTAQSRPQCPIHTCWDSIVGIARRWSRLLLQRFRVPQIDMQALDLFDQQQNRLSGRAKIVIAVGMKTCAPGTKLLDLSFVQSIAQGRSIHQRLAPQSNSVALGSSPRAHCALVVCGLRAGTECRASSDMLRRFGRRNGLSFLPSPQPSAELLHEIRQDLERRERPPCDCVDADQARKSAHRPPP
jgi:hypothetical protein